MSKKSIPIYHGYKLILSGSVLELFNYKHDFNVFDNDPREMSLARARSTLKRLINANAGQWWNYDVDRFYQPLFLTLTFAENLEDITKANLYFKDFIKRFNYHFYGSKKAILKYVCVIEFQERGAVHYHCILFNVPFIGGLSDRLAEVWTHGFIMVNVINNVRNVGSYVVKYMSKDISDDRLRGRKTYFRSRGLLKPIVIKDDDIRIANYLDALTEGSLVGKAELEGLDYEMHTAYNSVLRLLNTSKIDKVEDHVKEALGIQGRLDFYF